MPGGIIIWARETKMAEMNISEPYENDFQLKKSFQPKLIFFAWEIGENLKKSAKSQIFYAKSQRILDILCIPLQF